MPQVIRSKEIEVNTISGECKLFITLELNINLNTGNISFNASTTDKIEKKEEDNYIIPDFQSGKIAFGNKAKE